MPLRLKRKMQEVRLSSPSTSSNNHALTESSSSSSPSPLLELLSQAVLEEIFNRLENASFIAKASCVCKSFYEAGQSVRSARLICLNKYHEAARQLGANLHDTKTAGESSTTSTTQTAAYVSDEEGSSSGDESTMVVFRDVVVEFLRTKPFLLQLRIEIESGLQSKPVPVVERRRTDFWLSDPFHLVRWVPSVQASLLHLCVVDYGQQAIMRRTTILKILSQNCKLLKTLDLRNMFIDATEMEDMPKLTNFTLRCVKVIGDSLNYINSNMRNLTTLALLGVFGVTQATLDFPSLKVLCLGLSTIAKEVTMDLPSLLKLQLKILCPEYLTISAPSLKYMAFNLEVRETTSAVEFRPSLRQVEEVLYGASSFATFWSLVASNAHLRKLFLDIPCMALGEDGKWLGVVNGVLPSLPNLSLLCGARSLGVLNIGPGLWHAMEMNLDQLMLEVGDEHRWPGFNRLIVHMIPHSLESCLAILRVLVKNSLGSLEVYVHTHSPVQFETIVPEVAKVVHSGSGTVFVPKKWTKSLNFSCFNF